MRKRPKCLELELLVMSALRAGFACRLNNELEVAKDVVFEDMGQIAGRPALVTLI
jgi:hypothetical protein